MDREAYLKNFLRTDKGRPQRQRHALERALEIRKFEIDLYWKRATYFWTFIGLIFTAYGYVVLDCSKCEDSRFGLNFELSYLLACLGFRFSLGWYFVNRASKAWQENWERHVDILEDEIVGPLYKTVIGRYDFWNLRGPYFFSVSKINQLLALFVTLVWAFLLIRMLFIWLVSMEYVWFKAIENCFPSFGPIAATFILIIAALIPILTALFLGFKGRTTFENTEDIIFRRREIGNIEIDTITPVLCPLIHYVITKINSCRRASTPVFRRRERA